MKSLALLIALLAIGGILVTPAHAEHSSYSGAGGLSFEFYNPDLKFIDDQLQRFTPGYRKVSGPIMTFGGFGYGAVGGKWKFGGYGFGGGHLVSATFPVPSQPTQRVRQDVTVSIGGGGIYTEYEGIHPMTRCEVSPSLGIGFGGLDIRVDQFANNVRWDDLWGSLNPDSTGSRKTFALEMSRGFFMLQPGIGVKYFLTDFMAIEARVSYLLMINLGDWEYGDVKLLDVPSNSMSAPVFGLRLAFGG